MARPRKKEALKPVYRRYSKGSEIFFSRKNNLDNVFDIHRFRRHPKYRPWKSLGEVLDMPHEHLAKRKAIRIFRDMLKMIAEDLLDRDIFIFPRQEFGYLKIGNLRDRMDLPHIPWDLRHDGAVYGGICVIDPMIVRTIGGKRYNLSLTQANLKKMRELRAQGTKY